MRHTRCMSDQLAIGRHSDDGELWWDGTAWQPAYTADRKYWFDGTTWVKQPRRLSSFLQKSERKMALALLVLLALWIAWSIWSSVTGTYVPDGQIRFDTTAAATDVERVLFVTSALFVIAVAILLGWRRRVPQLFALGIAVVASLFLVMFIGGAASPGGHMGVIGALGMGLVWGLLATVFGGMILVSGIAIAGLAGYLARIITDRVHQGQTSVH
jgi:hypothetical protein